MIVLIGIFCQIDTLSLDQALERGLNLSPTYLESRYTLDKSRLQFWQSLTGLLPTVTATGTYTKTEYPENGSSERYATSMNLSLPVFDLDLIGTIAVAGLNWRGNRLKHQADVANLVLRIKAAYYNLANARALTQSSELALQRAEENLKLIQTKYELGAASRLDLLQAEVLNLQTRQERAQAVTQEITAQEELKSLLGQNRDIEPRDSLVIEENLSFPPLDSIIRHLNEVNYEIRLAREMEKAARVNLTTSLLAFLPRISAFYGFSTSSESLRTDLDFYTGQATKNYGISVSFPIFEIKGLIFKYLNARKDYQLKKISRRLTVQETEKNLRTAYYGLQEAYEKLQLSQRMWQAAAEAANLAREQYQLGVLSLIDWLKAESDQNRSKIAYNQALSGFYIQRLNFSYLLGETTFAEE